MQSYCSQGGKSRIQTTAAFQMSLGRWQPDYMAKSYSNKYAKRLIHAADQRDGSNLKHSVRKGLYQLSNVGLKYYLPIDVKWTDPESQW